MRYAFNAARFILADFASTLLFVVLYELTHSFLLATLLGIALGVGQILLDWIRRRPIDALQWLSLGLVTVMGGATLLTHDPRFVMIKPTIIYLAVAAVMLRPGWMNRYLPPVVADYAPELGKAFGYVWCGTMALTALANLALVAHGDPRLWAGFVAVVPLATKIVLFLIQFAVLRVVVGGRVRRARAAVAVATPDDAVVMTAN